MEFRPACGIYAEDVNDIETGPVMKIPTLVALLVAAMLGGLALIFAVM